MPPMRLEANLTMISHSVLFIKPQPLALKPLGDLSWLGLVSVSSFGGSVFEPSGYMGLHGAPYSRCWVGESSTFYLYVPFFAFSLTLALLFFVPGSIYLRPLQFRQGLVAV